MHKSFPSKVLWSSWNGANCNENKRIYNTHFFYLLLLYICLQVFCFCTQNINIAFLSSIFVTLSLIERSSYYLYRVMSWLTLCSPQ